MFSHRGKLGCSVFRRTKVFTRKQYIRQSPLFHQDRSLLLLILHPPLRLEWIDPPCTAMSLLCVRFIGGERGHARRRNPHPAQAIRRGSVLHS
jgi:hypothetical protein